MSMVLPPLMFLWLTSGVQPPLVPLGRFDLQAIPEASGIVKSRRHPGIFWVHNDSGNAPVLFAIRSDARIVGRFRLAIPNIDWEDIAIDDQGHLYIGDIGNNGGVLPIRAIYRVDEPDPSSNVDRPLPATASTFYAMPRSGRFDAEGLIYDRGNAIVVAKYLDGREAELFSFPFEPPSPLARPARPQSIGRLPGFTEAATGASLSEDRSLLAVCSTSVTRIYRRGESPPWFLAAELRYEPRPIEGIAWDGRDLIVVAEGGGTSRLSEASWRAASRGVANVKPASSRPEPTRHENPSPESK